MADGKVTIDSELNDKGLDQGLKNLQGKLEGTGKKLQNIGGSLTKNLTLPIVAAGTGALLTAKNFDDSMRKVKATMGDSLGKTTKEAEKNFKALRDEAIKLGATTSFSASDAAAAMEELALKGWDTNQILSATGPILNLASASGMELGATANLVSGQMAAFGLKAEKAEWAADMFQVTASSSGTTVEDLGHALQYAGGNASAAGMDLIQTNAILGAFANTNITGSQAGTTFNAMLSDLRKSAKNGVVDFGAFQVQLYDTNGEMKDMGTVLAEMEKEMDGMTTAQKDAAMAAVFGEQAQRGVNSILEQGTDVVMDLEEAMRNGEGAAAAAAKEMEGGIGGALRALASAAESLAISFGDVLAPHIQKVAEFLSKLALKFSQLSESKKKTIVIIGAVLAAIGPLLSIIGTLVITISAAVGAIGAISAPVWIVIGVIGALIAIGVALYQNWDTVKAKAIEVFSHFTPLLDTVKGAFQTLGNSVTPIMENLKTLWQSLLPILEKLGVLVGTVLAVAFGVAISIFNATVAALGPLINAVISLADFVVNAVNLIVAVLTGDFAGAMEFWNAMTESSINFFVSLWEGVVNFFKTFIDTIVDFFYGLYMTLVGNSIIPDMVEAIVEWFQNMFGWLIDIVSNIVSGVVDAFSKVFETIKNYLQMAKEIVMAVLNYIKDTFKNILSFLVGLVTGDFGKMKDAIQNQMKNAQNLLKNIWNAIDKFLTKTLGNIWTTIKSIFSNIFNTISSITNNIRNAISNGFNAVRNVISTVVSAIRNLVSSGFNAVRSVITSVINAIRSVITSGFNAARSVVSSVTSAIRSTVSNIFNSLKGIVTNAMSGVKNAVSNGIKGALNVVSNMAKNFYNAGKNIVTSIADGIKGAIGKVTDAIGNVTKKIRNFLPFSPAKEGPLMDIHRLNFGGPIEDSIEDAIPDVQAKMDAMLKMPTFQPPEGVGVVPQTADHMGQIAALVTAVKDLAKRPASFQIDGVELVRLIADDMDLNLTDRLDLEAYFKGVR